MNNPIQISENCWRHTDQCGYCIYTKTSDPKSDFHREDGPAVECFNGTKLWYINGKLHREDGPAIEYAIGAKEWWWCGKHIDVSSQEEFELYIRNQFFI